MRDAKLRILGQLTINIISFFCFYLSSVIEGGINLIKLLFFIIITTFVVWESLRLFILLARKKYPGISHTTQRLFLVTFFTLLIVAIIPFVKRSIGEWIDLYGNHFTPPLNIYDYLRVMGQNIFYCLFITALYEAIYFFDLWRQMFQKAEDHKKEKLTAQLNALKTQVNPHFLFNSLNTLSIMVKDDGSAAERFIDEMAYVYRYLLNLSNHDLVPLKEELKFIKSYSHLLQTRFNDNFRLHIHIPNHYLDYLLPPLSLQLLVENAVKHNMVTAKSPLDVSIEVDTDELKVQNPIQRKRQTIASEKKGLNNIVSRFKLLNLPPVHIEETQDYFTVTLPLVKPSL